MHERPMIAGYLTLQAIAILCWWCLLWRVPESIGWFHPADWPPEALFSFVIPDLTILAFGSVLVAFGVAVRRRWASFAIHALALASLYPTLYCLGVSWISNESWLATALMASMSGITVSMATIQGRADQQTAAFRVSPMSPAVALFWTIFQTVIFWGVFLWIIPFGLDEVETRVGIAKFSFPGMRWLGWIVLASASVLGLSSGLTMALAGRGTPLPTVAAPELVVAGPYRRVRNPMALAGIIQGVAVGVLLGSVTVVLYSLLGAFVWHFFVRPAEEADLLARFGDSYQAYCQQVRLWLPMRRR